MMRIEIKYDSCWRNSFLDGSNNEPISKENVRKFIATSESLKKNFKECPVTQDTVIGVLNRLIGDQRKLYLSRADKDYYFKDLEDNFTYKVKFNDDIKVSQQEVVYLRNMNVRTDSSYDPNSFCGIIRTDHELFDSGYSKDLWKIIFCELDELVECIVKQDYSSIKPLELTKLNPIKIVDKLKSLSHEQIDLNNINLDNFKKSLDYITDFQIERDTKFLEFQFYSYAFYEQIDRLKQQGYDIFTEEKDNISGIDINSYNNKNFVKKYESDHELFDSDYSKDLWGVWFYKFDDLIKFILDKDYKVDSEPLYLVSIQLVLTKLDELKKIKIKIDKSDTNTKKALKIIRNKYYDEKGVIPKKFSFYAYAFYEQIKRLKSKGCNVFTEKKDNISGISANSFTLRDFSKYFANKKLVYGAPYKLDDKALTKATGELTINLNISDDQAQDLQQKILDAGVSPFYLGKKGVAYVKDIRVNGTSIYDDY